MKRRMAHPLAPIKVPPPPPSISKIQVKRETIAPERALVARMSLVPVDRPVKIRPDLSPTTEQALFKACADVIRGQPNVDPDFAEDLYEFQQKEQARERATRLEPQRLGQPKSHVKSKFREGSMHEEVEKEKEKQRAQKLAASRGRPNTTAPQRKNSDDSIQNESFFSKRSRSASKDRKSRPKTAGAKVSEGSSLRTSNSNASSTDKPFSRSTTATSLQSGPKSFEQERPKTHHEGHKSTFSAQVQARLSKHEPFPRRLGSVLGEYIKPKTATTQPPASSWWTGTAKPGYEAEAEQDPQEEAAAEESESSDSEPELDLDIDSDIDADELAPLREALSGASSQQQQNARLSIDSLTPRSPSSIKRHSARLSADLSGLVHKVTLLSPREVASVIDEDGQEVTMNRREEKARDKDLARLVEEKMRGSQPAPSQGSAQRLRPVQRSTSSANRDIAMQRAALAISSGKQPFYMLGSHQPTGGAVIGQAFSTSSSTPPTAPASASAGPVPADSVSTEHGLASEKKIGGLRRQLSKLSFGLGGNSRAAKVRRGEPIVEEERACYPVRA